MNILQITPDFNYACGRSYYVYLLMKYLNQSGHNVFLLTNGGDSLDRLAGLGLKFCLFEPLHSKDPVSYTRSILKIKKLVRENSIDVVHTHHRYSELLTILAVNGLKQRKIKTVFTSLSIVDRRYKVEYKSDRIIAVSNAVKKMLVDKFGVSELKVDVINNFTDTDEIHELEVMSHQTKDHSPGYNILSIGRFHKDKSFETLLEALYLMNDPAARLILIGEGKESTGYAEYVRDKKLNVELVLPRKNLLEYFLTADLCVLPSVRDPFPGFMLQSGLHNKPFIGANVDGISELIHDGKNGLLFESGKARQLAERIKLFKSDRGLSSQCASNLHADVINQYTQEFIIPKIEKLYQYLLEN